MEDLRSLNEKADILRNSGKERKAIPLYKKLAKAYDEQGDVFHAGGALQMIGVCYKIAKDEKNSLPWLQKALDYYQKHHHTTGQGNVWRDMGVIYEYVGKYRQAEEALDKSAKLLESSEDLASFGITIAKLGLLAMRQKEYQKAEALLKRALTITHAAGHWFFELTTLLHLTELAILTNRLDDAESFANRVVGMLDHPVELGHENRRAEITALRAVIARKRGRGAHADELAQEARQIIKDADPEVQKQFAEKWYFRELA